MRAAILALAALLAAPAAAAARDVCDPPAADASSGELTAHAVALMYGECGPPRLDGVGDLLSRAILDDQWSWWGRTWAIRTMVDALVAEGSEPALIQPTLETLERVQHQSVMSHQSTPPEGQGAFFDHAMGWIRYRQGRIEEAVTLWRGITDNRHWREPVPGIFYADLGDAYADLGQHDAAQSYWRQALAARWRPEDTGWDRTRTERRLADSIAEHGAASLLPTQNGYGFAAEGASELIDLGGLQRDGDRVRYSIYTFLPRDEDGVAWHRTDWEGDCGEPRRLRSSFGGRYDADGRELTSWDQDFWTETASLSSLQDTELEMMCSTAPGTIAAGAADPRTVLVAYRAKLDGKTP